MSPSAKHLRLKCAILPATSRSGKRRAMRDTARAACLGVALFSCGLSSASAASLYQDGAGARAMSMGGAGTAVAADPLDALFDNPAALGKIDKLTLQLGGSIGIVQGYYHDRANPDATLTDAGFVPQFAASVPIGPIKLAVGFNPDIAVRARWHYEDTPGGADGGTSYGYRLHESEIELLRNALGAGWQVTPTFAVGGNIALLYNRNLLHSPYIFQSQPTLRTVKTLLDLDTDGFGWNAQGSLRWEPVRTLALSVTYTSESRLESHGRATGNAGVQLDRLGLGAARHDFAYDAEVTNVFPQQVSAGAEWKTTPTLTLSAQFDWINYARTFDTLVVRLTRGNNANLNGLVGSKGVEDNIPLDWSDQYVGRVGVEKTFGEHWAVRAGYAYSNNPVPSDTLTPLTAPITEHLITLGFGYKVGRFRVDAAYQWELPATGRVRDTRLAAGEYANSVVEINIQQLNVTVGYVF